MLRFAGCLILLLILIGCPGAGDRPAELRVAAAADLKFALDALLDDFRREHPGCDVRVTYGSSGNFHAQLTHRAPFDIYFSADIDYPRALIKADVADESELFEYAVGRIVLWVPARSPIDVQGLRHEALLHPAARKIAIANPAHAPYGRAAEAAMRDLGVYERVQDRLVLGENIAQAAQFIESGAAEIGIIALALAIAPEMKDKGRYWEIPLEHFPRKLQGGVIPRHARNPEDAARLRDFVTSEHGRGILRDYGFYMPED
jgi:molybdate transport system substrate-binding protein